MTIEAHLIKVSAQVVTSFTLVVKAVLVRSYTVGKKMKIKEDENSAQSPFGKLQQRKREFKLLCKSS